MKMWCLIFMYPPTCRYHEVTSQSKTIVLSTTTRRVRQGLAFIIPDPQNHCFVRPRSRKRLPLQVVGLINGIRRTLRMEWSFVRFVGPHTFTGSCHTFPFIKHHFPTGALRQLPRCKRLIGDEVEMTGFAAAA